MNKGTGGSSSPVPGEEYTAILQARAGSSVLALKLGSRSLSGPRDASGSRYLTRWPPSPAQGAEVCAWNAASLEPPYAGLGSQPRLQGVGKLSVERGSVPEHPYAVPALGGREAGGGQFGYAPRVARRREGECRPFPVVLGELVTPPGPSPCLPVHFIINMRYNLS